MIKHASCILAFIMLVSLIMVSVATAGDCLVELYTNEYTGDIVYSGDGNATFGPSYGFLTVHNPASASRLLDVNITAEEGVLPKTFHADIIYPSSGYDALYTLDKGHVKLPLKFKEAITPSSLSPGVEQEVRLSIEAENVGDNDIRDLKYEKTIPEGLQYYYGSVSDGNLSVTGYTLTWTLDSISQGERPALTAIFKVTPMQDIHFKESLIWYIYESSFANTSFYPSCTTDTSVTVKKFESGPDIWSVSAVLSPDNEFPYDLRHVNIYRSDVSAPSHAIEIKSYEPGERVYPGETWEASFTDTYAGTPIYFIRMGYNIPFTIDRKSMPLTPAKTMPYTISITSVPAISPGPASVSYPYITPTSTPSPSATITPGHMAFISPARDSVIMDSNVTLEVAIPASSDKGFVAFYASHDNVTWTFIGKSDIREGSARYYWPVCGPDGLYYLKAERYTTAGLVDMAYTRMVLASGLLPISTTTILTGTNGWLPLLMAVILACAAIAMLLLSLRKPVVLDTSSIELLSERGWKASYRLRYFIFPDVSYTEMPEAVHRLKVKLRAVIDVNAAKRLEANYGIKSLDAMAIQLARETGATLYTADAAVLGICRRLGIKAEPAIKLACDEKRSW